MIPWDLCRCACMRTHTRTPFYPSHAHTHTHSSLTHTPPHTHSSLPHTHIPLYPSHTCTHTHPSLPISCMHTHAPLPISLTHTPLYPSFAHLHTHTSAHLTIHQSIKHSLDLSAFFTFLDSHRGFTLCREAVGQNQLASPDTVSEYRVIREVMLISVLRVIFFLNVVEEKVTF